MTSLLEDNIRSVVTSTIVIWFLKFLKTEPGIKDHLILSLFLYLFCLPFLYGNSSSLVPPLIPTNPNHYGLFPPPNPQGLSPYPCNVVVFYPTNLNRSNCTVRHSFLDFFLLPR